MNGSEAVLTVISALDSCGIPYILVGSYSTNLYGIPPLVRAHGTRALLDEIRDSIPPI
jgi:hypothetical protein